MPEQKRETELVVGFGLGTYLPPTQTWIANFLRSLPDTRVLVMARRLSRDATPLPGRHSLVSFPDLRLLHAPAVPAVVRRIALSILSRLPRLEMTYFTARARRAGCRLIHGHFASAGWHYAPVARAMGVPLVVSFYGHDYDRLPAIDPRWKDRYAELYRVADLFLVEGEHGRKALLDKGVQPGRVMVHRLGVDVDAIPCTPRQLLPGEPLRLIQAASFYPKKGHAVFIGALQLLKQRGLGGRISVTFIGSGPLKGSIEEAARQLGSAFDMRFSDHIPYEDLHRELMKHHLFVQPSLTAPDGDCEGGAPVTLLDAQATGMPVVSTHHCDIPEEVLDGVTGTLVPQGDAKALADAIGRFISEPALLESLGGNCRRHIEARYSSRVQAAALEQIYRSLIGAGKGRAHD